MSCACHTKVLKRNNFYHKTMFKAMGVMDLVSALILALFQFEIIVPKLTIIIFIYLLAKAISFWGDFASFLDGLCALYMILMYFGFRSNFVFIIIIYLLQKGFLSLSIKE